MIARAPRDEKFSLKLLQFRLFLFRRLISSGVGTFFLSSALVLSCFGFDFHSEGRSESQRVGKFT